MFKHIGLFRLKDSFDGRSKEENRAQIVRNVRGLKEGIAAIHSIEVGRHDDVVSFPAYDMAVFAEFESVEDYEAYFAHPLHKEAAAFAAQVSEQVAGITYDKNLV